MSFPHLINAFFMILKHVTFILLFLIFTLKAQASSSGKYLLWGNLVEDKTSEPIPYASIRISKTGLWTVTDEKGEFSFNNVPEGNVILEVKVMRYASRQISLKIEKDTRLKNIRLKPEDLSLPDVEVTAQKKTSGGTTSYLLDRSVLDHAQVLNLSDISSLLPGGQTVNSSLINDNRMALRASSGESGNAAFGTAIEIDGIRLDNNANMDETLSSSTRNLSAAHIGSVEVVAGIPGVEHGDVSNGLVKVNSRRGASPWIVEASINPYSRQFALVKGLSLNNNGGIFNFTLEHAQSFSSIASPHTSYKRNIFSVNYSKIFFFPFSSLNLNVSFNGNLGGYKSEADPDAFQDTYSKVKDNQIQGTIQLDWIKNSDNGIFKLNFQGSAIYSDKLIENNTNMSSSSTQAYIHTMEDGYHIAKEYTGSEGVGEIILGPTGYWYVRQYNDQKPLSIQVKFKGSWTKEWEKVINMVSLGGDFSSSSNKGRGIYYEDMSYAPTWRPYEYRDLPALNTLALYIEDKLMWQKLTLTAGLRNDNTFIKGTEYGRVSTFSPRVNISYNIFKNLKSHLNLYAGYGKGVKLPSFQVLYPSDSYSDKLVFTPGSTADNKAFYAYYTHVSKVIPNKDLKWQKSHQIDMGVNLRIRDIDLSFTGYLNTTCDPYQMVNIYTPFEYNYTSQAALENCGIPSEQRDYFIDPSTGIVTVISKADGTSLQLPYSPRRTYISNRQFVNGSKVTRYGLEWILSVPLVPATKPVSLSLRFDGNYYHYKGISNTLIAGSPSGIGDYSVDSGMSPMIGYYSGSNITSVTSGATPTVSNGFLNKGANLNTTFTMRVPKLKLIVTLRVEASLLNYKRQLADADRAILLETAGDVFGKPYHGEKDAYVAIYPEFYSTWENPGEKIPFAESLVYAKDNDPELFKQLCNLILRSNTSYYFNPQNTSAYFSANFSITKEIGKWVSLSIYANNFFNNMSMVRNSHNGLESSLFNSGYIPKFYYGVALRIKI